MRGASLTPSRRENPLLACNRPPKSPRPMPLSNPSSVALTQPCTKPPSQSRGYSKLLYCSTFHFFFPLGSMIPSFSPCVPTFRPRPFLPTLELLSPLLSRPPRTTPLFSA